MYGQDSWDNMYSLPLGSLFNGVKRSLQGRLSGNDGNIKKINDDMFCTLEFLEQNNVN